MQEEQEEKDIKALEAAFLLCRMQHKSVAAELRHHLEAGPSDEKAARALHVKAFMNLCDRKGKAIRALEAAARNLQNALEPKSDTESAIVIGAAAPSQLIRAMP
ncbi:MAG: hypothetical protein J0H17_19680 [Rhizobiales bacterium]|nr:hypothetical protein [Hyphomicrobiales bacterium]